MYDCFKKEKNIHNAVLVSSCYLLYIMPLKLNVGFAHFKLFYFPLLLIVMKIFLLSKESLRRSLSKDEIWLIVGTFPYLLSLLFLLLRNPTTLFHGIYLYFGFILPFMLYYYLNRYDIYLRSTLFIFVGLVIIIGGCIQYLNHNIYLYYMNTMYPELIKGDFFYSSRLRFSSIFYNPNVCALILVAVIIAMVANVYVGEYTKTSYVLILLLMTCLILTKARAVMGGFFLYLSIIGLSQKKGCLFLRIVILLFLLVGIYYLFSSKRIIFSEMSFFLDVSALNRILIWREALKKFWVYFFFGTGLEQIRFLVLNTGYSDLINTGIHNSFLKVFFESGILGFLVYLFFWFQQLLSTSEYCLKREMQILLLVLISASFFGDEMHSGIILTTYFFALHYCKKAKSEANKNTSNVKENKTYAC